MKIDENLKDYIVGLEYYLKVKNKEINNYLVCTNTMETDLSLHQSMDIMKNLFNNLFCERVDKKTYQPSQKLIDLIWEDLAKQLPSNIFGVHTLIYPSSLFKGEQKEVTFDEIYLFMIKSFENISFNLQQKLLEININYSLFMKNLDPKLMMPFL